MSPAATASYTQLTRAEETALMADFQAGRRPDAFEALYRATAPSLLLWIEQLCAQGRCSADPLDALQDTFVNVYRYAASFRQEAAGGFRAWSRTIASNAIRRSRRRPHTFGLAFTDMEEGALPEPTDPVIGPLETVVRTEESTDLRKAYALMLLQYAQAYDTLKPRDQEALAMVEVEGLAYSEVGRRLGVGRSNTKMIVFRARQRLRARIAAFSDAAAAAAPGQESAAIDAHMVPSAREAVVHAA
ncbi:MAG: RNA polymerase sigma factor [Planctomycetota bacterium]